MPLSASERQIAKLAMHIQAMQRLVAFVTTQTPDQIIANLESVMEEARNAEQGTGTESVRATGGTCG